MRHLDLLRRFPFKAIGWKNWVQKLLEVVKTPNKPNQRPKFQLLEQGDLFWQSNHPVRVLRKSKTCLTWLRKHQWKNWETSFPVVCQCLLNAQIKTKDADENVDADHARTGRPFESEQSIGLFTHIDFRVSGLPHAVVKQAENFSVRELVKKIESQPHRQALRADLQQNNAYNPLSDEAKAIIRELGNVELFELCETIPKVQCSECLLYWDQGIVYCTCGYLLVESESSQHFHQWRLDAFSIQNYVIKKGRPRGARHGKTESQKKHFVAHNARRRCLKKKFDGIHDRFQRDPTYRDAQLKIGWTEEKCIEMDKLAQEDQSYCPSSEEYERYRKNWFISLNKSGRNAPMKLRSDFREALPNMNRLHRESGEERPEPIPFHQYQRWHLIFFFFFQYLMMAVEWTLVELIFLKFVVARLFTADGNLLQPTEVWTEHPHTAHLLVFHYTYFNVAHDIGSRLKAQGCPHHVIHASCAVFVLISLRLCTLHSSPSLSSSFSFSWSSSSSSMWVGSEWSTLCASANEELGTLADNNPLTLLVLLHQRLLACVSSLNGLKSRLGTFLFLLQWKIQSRWRFLCLRNVLNSLLPRRDVEHREISACTGTGESTRNSRDTSHWAGPGSDFTWTDWGGTSETVCCQEDDPEHGGILWQCTWSCFSACYINGCCVIRSVGLVQRSHSSSRWSWWMDCTYVLWGRDTGGACDAEARSPGKHLLNKLLKSSLQTKWRPSQREARPPKKQRRANTKGELWTVYELATACPERCANTEHMKLSGYMTMKYSIHMLKYIIHMCTMCDYEVLPTAGTAMRKRDFEDLPPAGTNSRTCAGVRKASPSSGRFTVTCLLCCHREGEFSRYHREAELHWFGYDTEFSFGPILAEFSKVVDLGEPTSFLDHVYMGCTQRQCEISKDIVDNCRTMFESRIFSGGAEKLPCSEILCISSWSYDMEEHAKNCVERFCELANRTTQQLYKVSIPCIDDHHFKEEELKSVGDLSKVCSQIVLKMVKLGTYWTTRYSMVSE